MSFCDVAVFLVSAGFLLWFLMLMIYGRSTVMVIYFAGGLVVSMIWF